MAGVMKIHGFGTGSVGVCNWLPWATLVAQLGGRNQSDRKKQYDRQTYGTPKHHSKKQKETGRLDEREDG